MKSFFNNLILLVVVFAVVSAYDHNDDVDASCYNPHFVSAIPHVLHFRDDHNPPKTCYQLIDQKTNLAAAVNHCEEKARHRNTHLAEFQPRYSFKTLISQLSQSGWKGSRIYLGRTKISEVDRIQLPGIDLSMASEADRCRYLVKSSRSWHVKDGNCHKESYFICAIPVHHHGINDEEEEPVHETTTEEARSTTAVAEMAKNTQQSEFPATMVAILTGSILAGIFVITLAVLVGISCYRNKWRIVGRLHGLGLPLVAATSASKLAVIKDCAQSSEKVADVIRKQQAEQGGNQYYEYLS